MPSFSVEQTKPFNLYVQGENESHWEKAVRLRIPEIGFETVISFKPGEYSVATVKAELIERVKEYRAQSEIDTTFTITI